MLISHIISLSFYHFSTRFPLTKSFNSYSPQKKSTTWHQGISAQMKKKLHKKIWQKLRDLAMKGKPRPSKLLGASRWSLTMQEWESPEFSRKKQTHLTCILAKFHHPDGKSRNACVGASKQRFNKVEVKSLPMLSKKYEMMSKFDSNLFGSDNKIQDEKNHLHPEVLWWKIEKSWHSFQIIPFPLIIGSGRLAKFKWWLRVQEAEDPIAIRSTSAQPPTSKIAIWNAHLLITISTKQFVILDHLMFFWGGLFGKILFVENKTLQVRFCRMLPAASRKVGGTEGHLRQCSAYLRSGPSGVKSRGKFSSVAPLKKALMVGLI